MALVLSDRVKETTTTSGTGSITLGGAVGGFVTFASAIGDGNKTYYVIENDTRWEIGVGTYSSGSLSRDSVLASSIGGGKISLSGVSFVFVSLPASKTNIWNEESGDVNLPATLTLPQVIAHKVTVSGDILSSGLTNFVRTTSGNFFHAYVNDSNKRTLALYTDAASSPQWKLGLKSNPNDVNTPPNYAYIYAEDGDIGLYANSQNYLSLTHGGGFSIVNKSDSIFTSASTTGTSIIGNAAAYPSLIVKAAPAQAADIQQWKNSADSTLVKIENDGSLVVGGSDIATDIRTNSASGVAISGWSNSTLTSVSGYFEAGGAVSGYFQYVTDNIPDATQVSGSLQPQITNNLTSGNINRDYTGSVSGWADTTITQRDNNVSGWVKTHVANQVDQTAIDSGNSNLARISTNITNIALNASGVISSGNLNHSLIGSVSGFYNYKVDTSGNILLTRMISSGNTNKDYTASVSGWAEHYTDSNVPSYTSSILSASGINIGLSGLRFNDGTTQTTAGGGGTTYTAGSGLILQDDKFHLDFGSGNAVSGYNQSYTDIKVAALVDSAPATLNTLNEIATALSGDASLAVTLTNKINSSGNKVYDTATAASLPVGSGAKIQANTSSITTNTTAINASGNAVRDLAIASGNKAYSTATAASLAVASGAKIQANTSNISTNSTAIIASGNANHASIATNTSNISTNAANLIASGNKGSALAIAASLPVGSGAKIQANAGNISTNSTAIIASGNANHASIATNTSNISTNSTAIIASGNANHASIATNTSNISTNATNLIASGNKGSALAIAASLPVGSGSKIQLNAGNITSNTTAINASGNANKDLITSSTNYTSSVLHASGISIGLSGIVFSDGTTQTTGGGGGAGLSVASGAKIQANTANISTNATAIIASGNANHASIATNTSNISTNATNLIASGNKGSALAIAASLPVGSGAKIQANAGNISTNATNLIASGNKGSALAIAASLPVGSGAKIQANAGNITSNTNLAIASGNKAYDTAIAVALTYAISSGNRALEVASGLAGDGGGGLALASGAKIQANTASITSNTNLINASGNKAHDTAVAVSLAVGSGAKIQANELALIASGNKAYDTAIAASLTVGSGAKIQANAGNITSNTNLINSSGNKAYDTAVAASLPVGSGAKIQANAANITSNTNLVNSSGNKAYDTAVAASLPVGSGAKIQVNAGNITSNTNLINSSGNKAYDTAVAASLAVGSGAKIQANELGLIASGNKAYDTAIAASLPVGSGAKIQANTANISTNATNLIASGNKAHDTATAASLAVGSGAKIQANELALIASGNKAYDTAIAVALTYAISSGNRALEVASGLAGGGGGGSFNNFTLTADGGSNQTIADGNTLDIAGGNGITTAVGATDTVTVNVDAAQTTITSLLATDIKIGEDDQTKIDFEDANQINFYADNVKKFEVKSDGLVASGCIRQLPNTLTDGGAVDIDCSTSNYHEVLMNADATAVNFTNVTAGQRVIVRFKQHSSHIDLNSSEGFNDVNVNGSNATIKWGGGVVPTLTESNNAVDVYGFIFESTVTNVMAFIIAQDVK